MSALLRQPWAGAWAAALAVWAGASAVSAGAGAGALLVAALTFGAFFALVAIGQMFVVTLGPGNVDLSIPACMTLAATVAMKAMDGADGRIALGLALALGVGAAVGAFNVALIRALRIPPIIATLSASFIVQSAAIWWNRGLRIKPPPALDAFATGATFGVPNVALLVIALSVLAHLALTRTSYGRAVLAVGQNARAAHLSGLRVERLRAATYVLCGVLAGLAGYLLAAFSGGAALNMGAEYLLASIAVVVIGGTSVAGGASNVPGLWGAALFLFLVVAMLNGLGLGAGPRLILTGAVIVAVIALAGGTRPAR